MMKLFDPNLAGLDVKYSNKENALTLCPFHSDRSASLSFNLRTGSFICFSCGVTGPIELLVSKTGGFAKKVDNFKAVNEDKYIKNFLKSISEKKTAAYDKYVMGRGISSETAVKFDLTADEEAVYIPLYSPSYEMIGVKVRVKNNPRIRYMTIGETPVIYGFDEARELRTLYPNRKVLFVEGPLGALRMHSFNVPSSAILSVSNIHTGCKIAKILTGDSIMYFDSDLAGRKATMIACLSYSLSFSKITKDVDDLTEREAIAISSKEKYSTYEYHWIYKSQSDQNIQVLNQLRDKLKGR